MSDYLLAAPIPPDGRLQVWSLVETPSGSGNYKFSTRWKATSNPDSQWTTPWAPFDPPNPVEVPFFYDMTAGVLSDGRTQIWGLGWNSVTGTSEVYTTWKLSTAHDSLWKSPWSKFDITPLTAAADSPTGVAVAALPDKRLQLFILGQGPVLQVWTAWKTTTDPNSPWTKLAKL